MRVYVIESPDEGLSKIGVSETPFRRVAALQLERKSRIFLRYETADMSRAEAHRIERDAHIVLSDVRAEGEWFRCADSVAIETVDQVSKTPVKRPKKSASVSKETRLVALRLNAEEVAMLNKFAKAFGTQRAAVVAGLRLLTSPGEMPRESFLAALRDRIAED